MKLTKLKIRSGLKHLSRMRACAAELGAMCLGIQQSHTRLTMNMTRSMMPLTSRKRARGVKNIPSANTFKCYSIKVDFPQP